jgi:cytochrome c553
MDKKTAKQLEAKIEKAQKAVSVAKALQYLAYDFSMGKICFASDSNKPQIFCWCAECHERVAELLTHVANVLDRTEDEWRIPSFRGVNATHLREHANSIMPK